MGLRDELKKWYRDMRVGMGGVSGVSEFKTICEQCGEPLATHTFHVTFKWTPGFGEYKYKTSWGSKYWPICVNCSIVPCFILGCDNRATAFFKRNFKVSNLPMNQYHYLPGSGGYEIRRDVCLCEYHHSLIKPLRHLYKTSYYLRVASIPSLIIGIWGMILRYPAVNLSFWVFLALGIILLISGIYLYVKASKHKNKIGIQKKAEFGKIIVDYPTIAGDYWNTIYRILILFVNNNDNPDIRKLKDIMYNKINSATTEGIDRRFYEAVKSCDRKYGRIDNKIFRKYLEKCSEIDLRESYSKFESLNWRQDFFSLRGVTRLGLFKEFDNRLKVVDLNAAESHLITFFDNFNSGRLTQDKLKDEGF